MRKKNLYDSMDLIKETKNNHKKSNFNQRGSYQLPTNNQSPTPDLLPSEIPPISNPKLHKLKLTIEKSVLPVMFLKMIFLSISYWVLVFFIALIQVAANDYCFLPNLCECENIMVYFYTILIEMIKTYLILIMILFYGASFITYDFFQKDYFRKAYLANYISILFLLFGFDCENRKLDIYHLTKMRNSLVLLGLHGFSLLILLLADIEISYTKEVLKRFLATLVFQCYLFFQVIYFKTIVFHSLLDYFKRGYESGLALSLFKLFMVGYMFVANGLVKKLFYFFYTRIDFDSRHKISMNIIFFMKFAFLEFFSFVIINIVTSDLEEIYTWINIFLYFFTVFTIYSRYNTIYWLGVWLFRIKVDNKTKSKETSVFEDLRGICVFEVNFIILLRLITYRLWKYFFIFQRDIGPYPYLDCSLKEKEGSFKIYDRNLMLVFCGYGAMTFGTIFYLKHIKKVSIRFDQVNLNIISDFLIFMACYEYCDINLQFFKELIEKNI